MSTIVSDVTASVKLAVAGADELAARWRTPMTTKANSPPGPSSSPVSIAAGIGTRNSRARPMIRMALMPIRPTTDASSQIGSRASSRKSMFMPTVKKNTPSSRPLNGSMVVSMALRYSVSASSRPATKAPSAIDRPAKPAATPVPTITNRMAATNSSLVPVAATRRNSGRSSRRPTMTMNAERQGRLGHGKHDAADDRAAHAVAENGDEHEDRHDRHVLREQDGEAGAAGRRSTAGAGWTGPR